MDDIDGGTIQGLAAFENAVQGLQPKVADNPDVTLLSLMHKSDTVTGAQLESTVASN